jgi:hypothetical protein
VREPFPRGRTGPVHQARSLSAGVRETVKSLPDPYCHLTGGTLMETPAMAGPSACLFGVKQPATTADDIRGD